MPGTSRMCQIGDLRISVPGSHDPLDWLEYLAMKGEDYLPYADLIQLIVDPHDKDGPYWASVDGYFSRKGPDDPDGHPAAEPSFADDEFDCNEYDDDY